MQPKNSFFSIPCEEKYLLSKDTLHRIDEHWLQAWYQWRDKRLKLRSKSGLKAFSSLPLLAPPAMMHPQSSAKVKTRMTKKANHLEQELQGRDKAELIAMIKLMLQQHPELSWVLQASQPVGGKPTHAVNSYLYQQQIETAVSAAAEHYRDRAYREALGNTLVTVQTVANEFARKADYLAALALYEVLADEAIKHYFTIDTGYLLFTPVFFSCIDGLDSCVAEAGENQEMRLRAFKGLFDIYRFSLASSPDLGEDIPDLLVGNTTHEERQILAGWVRDELARFASSTKPASKEYYQLLRRLEQEDLPV